MALAVTYKHSWVNGDRTEKINWLAFDNSYPTGGEALTPAQLGFRDLQFVSFESDSGYSFKFDRTNNKVLAYNGTTQVADTTDLSALTAVRCRAVGR